MLFRSPLFLRLAPALAITETFKKASHRLAAQGFDPAEVADPLLFDDPAAAAYVPLDLGLFERIGEGAVRL